MHNRDHRRVRMPRITNSRKKVACKFRLATDKAPDGSGLSNVKHRRAFSSVCVVILGESHKLHWYQQIMMLNRCDHDIGQQANFCPHASRHTLQN